MREFLSLGGQRDVEWQFLLALLPVLLRRRCRAWQEPPTLGSSHPLHHINQEHRVVPGALLGQDFFQTLNSQQHF